MGKGVYTNAMFDEVLSMLARGGGGGGGEAGEGGQSCCSGVMVEDGCGLLTCEFLYWAIGGVLDNRYYI